MRTRHALVLLAGCAGLPAPAFAQPGDPPLRWSLESMRPNRITRPADMQRRPPVRLQRRATPPAKAVVPALPSYGEPDPPLMRVPQT